MTSMSPTYSNGYGHDARSPSSGSVSPRQPSIPKNVAFELFFPDAPQYRARLPMRVQIFPHDTTDSIVTTVKNFYGLYSGPTGSKGVSFEDDAGNTLIARYENFTNNMKVHVRVMDEPVGSPIYGPQHSRASPAVGSPAYQGHDGTAAHASHLHQHDISRPASRTSRRRSRSPGLARDGRSASASTNGKKARSRSVKNRGSAAPSQPDAYSDSLNGYSSGDNASTSTSARMKEQLGNTDISVENIVEGGRRKRAKFESSELPLFAPPQMPAATSNHSVSPARRTDHHRPSFSYAANGQNPFTHPRTLPSPQQYHGQAHVYATPDSRRSRSSIGPGANGATGVGVLPTPDPTVGSAMSEEDKDVALQLMRLGDMSNISHGRTSASTLDETFSGRADATSSTGATSDGESENQELPPARRQKVDSSGVYQTTSAQFAPPDERANDNGPDKKSNAPNVAVVTGKPTVPKLKAVKKPRPSGIKKSTASVASVASATTAGPMSPASLPTSRKPSISSVAGAAVGPSAEDDQPDLSSKPRCQRCRKSKKGCDRQRPCQRCRDAGLSADQCISEDENNGRKGRYGRHMGVPLKQDEVAENSIAPPILLPAAQIATAASMAADKSKKRKR